MEKTHPALEIYDRQANSYDLMNSIMEFLFSKGRTVYKYLRGEILEVGVGTGENLKYYHPSVKLSVLDWSPKMIHQTKMKVNRLGLKNVYDYLVGNIENISQRLKPNTFGFVTSTCVFCSVPDPIKGLKEISKILRPTGKLVQIEHGISNVNILNFFMKKLDPLTVRMRGFHLVRNSVKNLEKAGFEVIRERFLDPAGIVKVIISKPKNNFS